MTRAFFTAALLTLSILPAAAAPAQIPVSYGDLNLATPAGQSELKTRLQDAAAKLCSSVLPGPDYRGSEQSAREDVSVYHACVGRLSDRALAQVRPN